MIRYPRSALLLLAALVVLVVGGYPDAGAAQPKISLTNSCAFPVWITELPNTNFPIIPSDNPNPASKLNVGQTANYTIPANGWEGQFRPKTGCDDQGNNCASGSSLPPCPTDGGCEPPGETKIEFFYGPLASDKRPYYDITLVDGYSLPATITPSTSGGRCTPTSCALALSACPTDEIQGIGDLRIVKNGQTVECLSPCKKWTSPPPYGMGRPENQSPGELMCCPYPVTPSQCKAGPIEQTKYVQLVHAQCPSAYSYSYDDSAGSHDCAPGTSFSVTFCQ
jgi:hypothetical protein